MLIPSAPFSQSSTESWQSYFLNSTRVHPPLHFPHQHHLSLDHSTRLLPGLPSPFSVCSSSFSTWQPDQIFHLHLWFKWLSITLRKMPQTLLARPSRPHMVWSHMSSPVCTQPRHVTFPTILTLLWLHRSSLWAARSWHKAGVQETPCWVNEYLAFHLPSAANLGATRMSSLQKNVRDPGDRLAGLASAAPSFPNYSSYADPWPFPDGSVWRRHTSIRCWSFLNLSISWRSSGNINYELNFSKRKKLLQNMPFSLLSTLVKNNPTF